MEHESRYSNLRDGDMVQPEPQSGAAVSLLVAAAVGIVIGIVLWLAAGLLMDSKLTRAALHPALLVETYGSDAGPMMEYAQ